MAKSFHMTVRTVGNPDFGQNPAKAFAPAATLHMDDVREAGALLRAFCDANGIGGGNLCETYVMDGNEAVARVSYNGRIWPPQPWTPGALPLFEKA